jgi:uncharacterized membrane protein
MKHARDLAMLAAVLALGAMAVWAVGRGEWWAVVGLGIAALIAVELRSRR